jgi:hypothetical protein
MISTQSGYMDWLIRKAIKLVPYKQHEQGFSNICGEATAAIFRLKDGGSRLLLATFI